MSRYFLLALGLWCCAVLPSSHGADKAKVDAAIKKGVDYLKKTLGGGAGNAGDHMGSGPAVLAGLALLESGTTKDEPVMQAITRLVRDSSYGETKTYNLVLNILYLDRLNEPADVPLIQVLGARLVIGQTNIGGWGYNCGPEIPAAEQQRLRGTLRQGSTGLHPEAANLLRVGRVGGGGGDDNSNTQFAVIGTWVAQRRGVPCSTTIQLIDTRFQRSQSPTDFGWSYSPGMGVSSTPAMTCAGLLGLAVGKAHDEARKAGRKLVGEGNPEARRKPKDKENENDPFYNPPARGDKPKPEEEDMPEEEEEKPEVKKIATARDMAIERALQALGRVLKDGGSLGSNGGNWGGVNDLYFIWSLERVGVAYGLTTIGDVDWYEWGVKLILPAQQQSGAWNGSHSELVETSFAVLFLGKANFVSDLTRQIDGKVKDPGNGELRGSRAGPPAIVAMGRKIEMNRDIPDPKSPNLNKVRGPSAADAIAEELLARQSDAKWDGKLKKARDSKGGEHTAGLAQAIPFLPEKRQILAREALADRASRMTKDTLAKMLKDRDVEMRRASCLAVAMREEKGLTYELIERVADIDDTVVRAARASLKSMYNQDFGPTTGANDDRKRAAFDAWNSWYTRGASK